MIPDIKAHFQEFSNYSFQLHRAIDTIGRHFEGQKVNLPHEVYISILNRVYVNIFSIHHLSRIFYEETVSSSIAILFRSCLSDIVLGHYLLSFKNDDITFKNETIILTQSFVKKYVNDVLETELKLLSNNKADFENRVLEVKKIILDEFSEILFDIEKLKTKSAKKIRDELKSNKNLFNDEIYNSEPTETIMFKHLFSLDSEMKKYYENIKIIWKYFSQFQHYTFPGRHFVNNDKKDFLLYFYQALLNCYDFVNVIIGFVFELEIPEFETSKEELFESYNNYVEFLKKNKAQ